MNGLKISMPKASPKKWGAYKKERSVNRLNVLLLTRVDRDLREKNSLTDRAPPRHLSVLILGPVPGCRYQF